MLDLLVARGSESEAESLDENPDGILAKSCSLVQQLCRSAEFVQDVELTERARQISGAIVAALNKMRESKLAPDGKPWVNCWSNKRIQFADAQAAFISWYVNTFGRRTTYSVSQSLQLLFVRRSGKHNLARQKLLQLAYAVDEIGDIIGKQTYIDFLKKVWTKWDNNGDTTLPSPIFSTAAVRKNGLRHALQYAFNYEKGQSSWMNKKSMRALYNPDGSLRRNEGSSTTVQIGCVKVFRITVTCEAEANGQFIDVWQQSEDRLHIGSRTVLSHEIAFFGGLPSNNELVCHRKAQLPHIRQFDPNLHKELFGISEQDFNAELAPRSLRRRTADIGDRELNNLVKICMDRVECSVNKELAKRDRELPLVTPPHVQVLEQRLAEQEGRIAALEELLVAGEAERMVERIIHAAQVHFILLTLDQLAISKPKSDSSEHQTTPTTAAQSRNTAMRHEMDQVEPRALQL